MTIGHLMDRCGAIEEDIEKKLSQLLTGEKRGRGEGGRERRNRRENWVKGRNISKLY